MAAPTDLRRFFGAVVSRISIGEVAIDIAVVKSALRAQLLGKQASIPQLNDQDSARHDAEDSLLHLSVAFALRRFSGSTHLGVPDGIHRAAAQPSVGLIRALLQGCRLNLTMPRLKLFLQNEQEIVRKSEAGPLLSFFRGMYDNAQCGLAGETII